MGIQKNVVHDGHLTSSMMRVVMNKSAVIELVRRSAARRHTFPAGGGGGIRRLRGLVGKRVVDFLLVIIELFFASCYACGATGEYLSLIHI